MVWFIVGCALVVLLLASFAAVGRFGEMREGVVDTPVVELPRDPFDPAALRLRRARTGYEPSAVDDFLRRAAGESLSVDEISATRFHVARPGYDIDQVDQVLDQLEARARRREAAAGNPVTTWPAASTSVRGWAPDSAWRDADAERRE